MLKKVFSMFLIASRLHAKWEIETSNNIMRSKKKILILLLLAMPAIVFSIVLAANDGNLPHFIGGKTAYGPAHYDPFVFWISILIGICAGLITGCIGAGGGFVITPALMSAGIKGILAVGTDLFHIFAKAIMGTAVHKKLGNVSVGLAIAFLVGSGIGVTGGGVINRYLYEKDPVLSDAFISIVYALLLGFLGIYALVDFFKLRKSGADVGAHHGESPHGEEVTKEGKGLPGKLQGVKIPPMIKFDHDLVPGGKEISGVFVAGSGVFVGFVAAIMGVGGGFLTFPIFVYVLGVSSFTTVGTDILQIIFTAGYASVVQYAIYGFVFYTLAMGMLLGSLLGIQIGALTTKVVKGIHIRGFYAITIMAGFVNRLFSLPGKLGKMKLISIAPETAKLIDTIGIYIFFIVVGIFGAWVFGKFFGNIKALRGEE